MVAAEAPKQAHSANIITAAKGERFNMKKNLKFPGLEQACLSEADCFSGVVCCPPPPQ